MGCEAGRERQSGGPGERIRAASEWGARSMQADGNHPLPILVRMVSVIGAGRERGSGRPVNGVRGGPGEAIGRA
jgi:hypothetical protein